MSSEEEDTCMSSEEEDTCLRSKQSPTAEQRPPHAVSRSYTYTYI